MCTRACNATPRPLRPLFPFSCSSSRALCLQVARAGSFKGPRRRAVRASAPKRRRFAPNSRGRGGAFDRVCGVSDRCWLPLRQSGVALHQRTVKKEAARLTVVAVHRTGAGSAGGPAAEPSGSSWRDTTERPGGRLLDRRRVRHGAACDAPNGLWWQRKAAPLWTAARCAEVAASLWTAATATAASLETVARWIVALLGRPPTAVTSFSRSSPRASLRFCSARLVWEAPLHLPSAV